MGNQRAYVIRISRSEKYVEAVDSAFDLIEPHPNPIPEKFRHIPILKQIGKIKRHLGPVFSDVYHSNERTVIIINAVDEFAAVVGLLCEKLGIPFIIRLRGTMWNAFQDRAHNKGKLRRWIYSNRRETVRDFVFSLADGIIPVTDFVVTQMLYETDIRRNKVKAINNTADVDRFEATTPGEFKDDHNIAKEDKILLLVTNFNYTRKYEAIEYFAPVIDSILRNHANWHFVVVGGGEDLATTRESVLDEFDDEVSDRVLFTGYYSDIEKAFVDASICTHLSFRDSAAMTVTEAQAAGKPVIVNTAGGMRDLLDSTSDSPPMIISERDELEYTLSELIESPKKRHCIGDHNKEYIKSEFSPELLGKKFEEAIEKFIT